MSMVMFEIVRETCKYVIENRENTPISVIIIFQILVLVYRVPVLPEFEEEKEENQEKHFIKFT